MKNGKMKGLILKLVIVMTGLQLFTCEVSGQKNIYSNYVNQCNIVWNKQSIDATGSIPLGGGNIGLNVWVEKGELLYYIGSPDAFDEMGNVIKLEGYGSRVNPIFSLKIFSRNWFLMMDISVSRVNWKTALLSLQVVGRCY